MDVEQRQAATNP